MIWITVLRYLRYTTQQVGKIQKLKFEEALFFIYCSVFSALYNVYWISVYARFLQKVFLRLLDLARDWRMISEWNLIFIQKSRNEVIEKEVKGKFCFCVYVCKLVQWRLYQRGKLGPKHCKFYYLRAYSFREQLIAPFPQTGICRYMNLLRSSHIHADIPISTK